jgi:hypothetical protein
MKDHAQLISFQLLDVPHGIDGKLILRVGTILALEPLADNINATLLRVSFPTYASSGQPMPGYFVKGSVGSHSKRLAEVFLEREPETPVTIDVAPAGLKLAD